MSDLAKVNNYDVKIRIKNHDLPKARSSDKTINFGFPKLIALVVFLTSRISERERGREN